MNPQYVQYAPQDAVNINVNGHFQPNAFAPGTYQQPLPYPAVPAGQHQQPYYSPVPAAQPQQESPQSALHASVQSHQYAQPPVASPSPGQNGPGAPPPDPQSPSLSQYADLSNNVRRDAEEDEDDGDALQPDGHDGNEPVFHLPPPPEATYPNEAALEEAVHSWSLEHGYELVRRASKKNARGVLYKRYMHCSKHGKAANTGKLTDQTRIRHNRKSQRMNCPMSLAVVAVDPNNPEGEWQVRHRKTHHNHGPLEALNLVGHRRRARAGGIEQAVDGLFAIGTPTAQVLQFLERTNPHGLFTRTDVANMKLKYKKFGTCLIKGDTASSHGRPCNYCRAKKTKCDNSRPSCSLCSQNGINCEYDRPQEDEQPSVPGVDGATETEMMQVDEDPLSLDPQGQQSAQRNRNRGTVSQFQQNAQRAEEILANLQAFQTQHVAPVKLDLQSSAVEILAASSCGSGESYKIVPLLQSASDWPAYRDLMTEACMKENTFEVLIGTKTEPSPPPLDCKVEDWNEYIKKLAIFNRRNTALSGVLWGTLAPTFRNRVQHIKNAAEIWSVLEDVCLPQGSDTGFRLYMELHDISHANSADLKDYIVRLENAYMAFNRLSHHWRSQHGNASSSSNTNNQSGAAAAPAPMPFSTLNSSHPSSKLPPAQPIFSEEMLCFLFLRNLAPEFARWAEGVCATNNVAGFGTGPKLGFVDLTRRAVEHEIALRCRR